MRRRRIRLAHDRRAVERPAVDADLQRSDADPVVALVVLHAKAGDDALDGGLRVVARADADRDAGAERQAPLRLQLLIVPEALGVAAALADARDADLVVPLHQGGQAVQILSFGNLRLRNVQQRLAVLHLARELAIRREVERAALGRDGRFADLCGLDCGVVQDLDVAVRILPGVHRGVGRGRFVEIALVRQAAFPDTRHVDARQPHPAAGAGLLRPSADPLLDLLNRMELDERLRHFAACRTGGVHVRLDEAGDDRPPAGIDDTRLGTGHLADGSGRADGGEGVPAYRHRFGLRVLRVDGQHFRVDDHEVHRRLLTGRRRRGAEQDNDGTDHPDSVLHWHLFRGAQLRVACQP